MVQPEDIRQKAANLYGDCLRAWLIGDSAFFPRTIPARKSLDSDIPSAIRMVQELKAGSKEVIGYGYTVHWREVNSREYGRNRFPERILFETRDDLLRFIGKSREFSAFTDAVAVLRSSFPELERWMQEHPKSLIQASSSLSSLVEVLEYFRKHPRPNCFARELPLSVDTKFIEHNQGLLQQWLDRVLPPHTIRADEEHFERRYGLRYAEPHVLIRFLDKDVQRAMSFPCEEVSIPLHTGGKWQPPVDIVLVVENKVNLFTLPRTKRAIGLGGLGRGISLLRYIPWLAGPEIVYWGDLDLEGLEILSSLRECFPRTRSILMDIDTVRAWEHLGVSGTGRDLPIPKHLTESERQAFVYCKKRNLRIEQERIPQCAVLDLYTRGCLEGMQIVEESREAIGTSDHGCQS